ncbi:efflux RND transporter periplasmic adaptor subunit [Methylobacterium sp. NEAU K]|uniref:efflux RND transporter periplasmic adaptor subunit n=1 Tax=Methylobacterium sp. NEAU K TaxID=3064946 RepID=UPI0027376A9C|nr:efflux RND transporter periplasmic adaptor subunit [Methylobacterium sp. NEAU K]MDP4003125.1 efflux RND transporter periplasmic adaptor subunit [Methylobacterium sp. NEAU K]
MSRIPVMPFEPPNPMRDNSPNQPSPGRVRSRRRAIACFGLVLLAGTVVVIRSEERAAPPEDLLTAAAEPTKPSVNLMRPKMGEGATDVRLPATIEAYNAAKLHARAGGYVREWFHDIGDHVKKGDILASIDSPDLDQQLIQARADLVKAKADADLADTTADRWKTLAAKSFVSQQAKDEKVGDAASKQGALRAAQANVSRLEALSDYKNIVAPFDGVVTTRQIDVGDLVGMGATSSKALFTVADIKQVRVYLRAPQGLSDSLKPGLKASLAMPQYPGQTFDATLVSTSNALSEESRSVLVQLQADNPSGKLWPGAYAEVTLHIPSAPSILHVPSSALIFDGRGMQVAVVRDDRVDLVTVSLGRNFGDEVEILSGLPSGLEIVKNPPDTLKDGDTVQVASTQPTNGAPVHQALQ